MSAAHEITADVDKTIAYWQNRGVSVVMIGTQLHCHRSWPAIRISMIAMARFAAPASLRRAA